jgi:hypothetical protein
MLIPSNGREVHPRSNIHLRLYAEGSDSMGIRDTLKKREEQRDKAASGGGGVNSGLPEGVTRYVRLGQELKDGKDFVILADPDNWFFYYVHEDGDFATRSTFVKKHTCLHSPKAIGADFGAYDRPNANVCLSCKAKAKRKLYFMVPVFDPQYGTWRILDLKEFHAKNLIGDYDKLEKAAKKFNKDYTLVGDAVSIKKTSDGKSYSLESADLDEAVIGSARKSLEETIEYSELANFRTEEDIRKLLEDADGTKIDKAALGLAGIKPIEDGPIDINDDDLPF